MLPGYTLPNRLRKFCRVLKWITVLFALIHVAVLIYDGTSIDKHIDRYWNDLADNIRAEVTYSGLKNHLLHFISWLAALAPLLILMAAYRIFAIFQTGEIFSLTAVRALRFLGLMIISYGMIQFSIHTLMIGALTYDNPPGLRIFSIFIKTYQVVYFMIGVIFLMIGHIYTEAVRLSNETRQIV